MTVRWNRLEEFDELPDEWELLPLLRVAVVLAGQSPASEYCNVTGDGIPFLQGAADFSERYPIPTAWCTSPTKTCEKDDILISVRAPVGEINRADQPYVIGRGLAAIRAINVDPNFLFHGLHRWRRGLQRVGQGTTFDAVTARHFVQLTVPNPPRFEQERIAQILDAVDTAIARTRDTLAKAERLKRGVLNELLKRGIGPKGRIRVDDKAAFHKTALGYLPVAWGVSKVRDEFIVSTGFTLGEHRRPKINRRRYLRVANVQRGSITLEDLKELEARDDEMFGRTLARNDLLVVEGHANPKEIGRCALVPDNAAGLTFQNHLFRLCPKQLMPEFAEIWLNSPWVQGYWQRTCASTSGLHTINQRTLNALPVVVPPLGEQRAIVDTIEALSANIRCIEAKLSYLMKLKRGLMQDLLTGRIRATHKPKTSGLLVNA